ncbi:uncharacterized protein LOC135493489 [Lineus longissimus]|uniref:uncharacterized protein LOC135493489 n=1 Tax=Lineus longissimus TaxID=88925 RepID=UPI00315DB37A
MGERKSSLTVLALDQLIRHSSPGTSDENLTEQSINLVNLPSVIITRILSFLPWKDKLEVVKYLPGWEDELTSPDAWSFFENTYTTIADRGQIFLWHQELCLCIQTYGKYFQHCKIVLNYYDLYDNGLHLLEAVSDQCCNLKTLALHHPICFGFNLVEVLHQYVDILTKIVDQSRCLRSISLFGLDYLALDRFVGMNELFVSLSKDQHCPVAQRVKVLEFSHAYDFSEPIHTLTYFDNLHFLKTEMQSLNTGIIDKLCSKKLRNLYLVNNGATLNEEFHEHSSIHWEELASKYPGLNVHYIFQGRTLHSCDLVTNSLVKSVVLDSMCNRVTHDLFEAIARHYGTRLELFAHLATEWSFMPYDDNLDQSVTFMHLLSHCPLLVKFLSQVAVSSSALLEMAESKQLSEIAVVENELLFDIDYAEDPEMYFRIRMDKLMGERWKLFGDEEFASYAQYLHKAGCRKTS